jgi:hypothetical protein
VRAAANFGDTDRAGRGLFTRGVNFFDQNAGFVSLLVGRTILGHVKHPTPGRDVLVS